jgi:hypothetical protein
MAIKERYQNPVCEDTVNLRLMVYNTNNFATVEAISKVEIFFLDPALKTPENPDGRRLVTTVLPADIHQDAEGRYSIQVPMSIPQYTIGNYIDAWSLVFRTDECPAVIEQRFQVYPDLWYTSPIPIVNDFTFSFRPNRLRHGAKQPLIIEITPNVPRASDLARYYENLAIVSPLYITIEQRCGDCVPAEKDLRIIVDHQLVELREKRYGYYPLDTREMDCGVYDITFELDLGDNIYISDRNQLEIFA